MRVLNEVVGLSRVRGLRLGVGGLAFAAVTVVTVVTARYRMFTGFAFFDDEGYLLIALKSFLSHGALYEDVFTQYGPFYYEFWGAIFSTFRISVDHEGGRTMTMVAWVLSSLLMGLSTWRMTRSILVGLATQMIVFATLITLVAEPMQTGGIIVLLVSTIVTISCFVRDRTSPFAMALLGGAVMALMLVKINVGTFALAAVVLVCVVSYPAPGRCRWLRPVVEVGFVALPLLLMISKAGDDWARHYAVHVSVAALAVVIALRAGPGGRRDSKELWWLGGGLLVVGIAVLLVILGTGTSPSALIDGIIKQPLRLPGSFSVPLGLSNWIYLFDLLALIGALGYWYISRNREPRPSLTRTSLLAALSIFIGLELALSALGSAPLLGFADLGQPTLGDNSWAEVTQHPRSGFQLGLLSFAWVALIPPPGRLDEATRFARLMLPALAVLQALHAFPVAGSQVAWSAFPLIPVGALCVANGIRRIPFSLGDRSERRAPVAIGAVVATAAMVVLVSIALEEGLKQARAAHDSWVPLGLPGAEDVRVRPDEAANYQAIVASIDGNCESFVMLPGMNSFYIWTQQQPPTGYNTTGWTMLLDDAHQQRVVEDIRSIDGLCLLENLPLARGWDGGDIAPGPLVRYLRRGFVPIATFGDYQLLKRAGSGAGS